MIVAAISDGANTALVAAAISAAATLSVAALTFVLGRTAESAARRRESYASATRELVAWMEMPYRIRRRASDAPEVLGALVGRFHDRQEAVAYRAAWIRSDCGWLADIFDEVLATIRSEHGTACTEAWWSPPASAFDMALDGWGPKGLDDEVARFTSAAAHRFGGRRMLAAIGFHPRPKGVLRSDRSSSPRR